MDYEKCSHGKKYKGEECSECDALWYEMTMSKSERKLINSLREVLEICRQWEPDCASGKDRNTLARAHISPSVLNAGLGVKIQLHVKRELFSFHCKQDWVNKAQSRYANCGVRKGFYITLDALGRVMHMGKCFENASYPVTVYELATTWVD